MSPPVRIPRFKGRLIGPADAEYEIARLTSNAAWDARPALIAQARDADDVAAVVGWARTTRQTLALRSGGHSVSGHSTGDGVIVLDLAALNELEIDEAGKTARAGPGVKAADYTQAAYLRGGATSFGDTGTVCLGGLIPGGGIGWLVRRHGMTIDSLLSVELITADGELLTASAEQHPDLFWAVRGGGGNFGVVTRYELALNPIGQVLHGMLLMPATSDAIAGVLGLGRAAPDDLTLMPYVMAIPPMDEVPATEHGRLGLWVDMLWAGPPDAGKDVLAALRAVGPTLMDDVQPKPYPQIYPEPSGNRGQWTASSIFLDEVDDDVIDVATRMLGNAPPGDSLAIFRVLGGQMGRVPNDATAFGWRDRPFLVWLIADFETVDDKAAAEAWVGDFRTALTSHGSGAFANFTADAGPDVVQAAYPPATLTRLREIKRRWDPDNLFRHNHNVVPDEA